MKKRFLIVMLAVLVAATLVPILTMTVGATNGTMCSASECNGTYVNGFCSVDDTHLQAAVYNEEDARYEISNAGQLYWFADKVRTEHATYGTATVVLTADITVNSGAVTGRNDSLRQWTPIGSSEELAFRGHFDGQGHSVSGLYFYDGTTTTCYVGLFGWIQSATVENVNIVNFYFQASRSRIGGVAGRMYSSTVQNCYTEGKIYAKDAFSFAGGVVASSGVHDNLITGCLANVSIQITTDENEYTITPGIGSKHTYVGAIVGSGGGTLSDSIYITDSFTGVIEDDSYTVTNGRGMALSEMTDGVAAHLLGAAWGQNIDNGQTTQTLPVLGGTPVYYGYTDCYTDDLHYSNTKLNPTKGHKHSIFAQDHELISACVYCGANEQGRLTLVAPADLIFSEGVAKSATYTCTLPDCTEAHTISYCCPDGCMTPGTHTASVTVGDATATLAFEITSNLTFPSDVTVEITTEQQYLYYRGASGVKPAVSVKKGGVELTKDTDYSVYYGNNINVTTEAQVTVVLHITGYEGASKTLNFEIVPYDLTYVLSSSNSFDVTYGDPMWGSLPVTLHPHTDGTFSFDQPYNLVEGVDYLVKMTEAEYKALDVGSHYLVIEGIGNFSGIRDAWIKVDIQQADLTAEGRFEITVENDLLIYNGGPQDPNVTVYDTLRGEYLTLGYDGDFYFPGHEYYPGTHSVSLMGRGNYTGSLDGVGTFEILKADAKPQLATNTVTMDYDPTLDIEEAIENALDPTLTLVGNQVYHGTLQYEYRAVGDVDFTSGLPVYAGAYEIRAVIGESNAPDSGAYNLLASEIATVTVNKLKVTVTVLDQYLEDGQSPDTYPSLGTTYTIEFANFADQILTEITLAVGTDGHDLEVSSLELRYQDAGLTDINANCDITINTGKAHRVDSTWTVGTDAHTRVCSVEGCGYVQAEAHHSHVLTQDDAALTVSGVCGICSADCGTITLVLPQNAVYNGKPHLATLTGEIRGIDLNDTAYVEIHQPDSINRGDHVGATLYVNSYGTDGYPRDTAMLTGYYSIAKAEVTIEIENVEIEQYSALPTEFTYTVLGLADGHTAVAEWLLSASHSNTVGTFEIALNGVNFYDADGNEVSDNYDYNVYTKGTLTITAHTAHREFDADGICGICGAGYETPETDEEGTYLLSKLGHLYWLAGASDGNAILNAKMVADINLNAGYTFLLDADGNLVVTKSESTVTDLSVLRSWTPIRDYNGIFDGNGFTVSGLYFNNSHTGEVGLFGSLGTSATIQNVRLVNSYILGQQKVGGIVGNNESAGTITNCYNAAIVVSDGQWVGGIVGYNGGVVSGCENVGRVNGAYDVGGIAGYNGNEVRNCINRADIYATANFGGIVGSNGSYSEAGTIIQGCLNTGDLTATGTYYYAGGIVGECYGTVKNCFNTGNLLAGSLNAAGGIAGFLGEEGIIAYCLNLGNVSCDGNVGGIVGAYTLGTVELCFYLSGTATGGIDGEDEENKAEAVTSEQLASGEISYRLNSSQSANPAWGQTLGTDTQPALGGAPVYIYYSCDTEELYTNTENTPNQDHKDTDGDHLCDACEGRLTDCEDNDNDHLCDICGEPKTACHDGDKDHKCDMCGETVSECKDDDRDHACDVCGTLVSECQDVVEKDHLCDICGAVKTSCLDADRDHDCDHCGETLTACEDLNNDHYCDTLGEKLSDCTDGDDDHYCDLCDAKISVCTDGNRNHYCDICSTQMTVCEDLDNDHYCDTLGERVSDCADKDGNHSCDVCDADLGDCVDQSPRDHKCDVCEAAMGTHAAAEGSHTCDYCQQNVSNCVDTDPTDHVCDICDADLGDCVDQSPRDHKCDVCEAAMGTHAAAEGSHTCDYCQQSVSSCVDTDPADHVCDICDADLGDCTDQSPRDHKCDVCEAAMGTHAAAEGSHTCDYCQQSVSSCVDTNPADHVCDICDVDLGDCVDQSPRDHKCDVCEAAMGTHAAAEGSHTCDYCQQSVSSCVDTDPVDHVCDICDADLGDCADGDADHLCDVCGARVSNHVPANNGSWIVSQTHHWKQCQICLAMLEAQTAHSDGDGDGDHLCDVCSYPASDCEDSDTDHICDECGRGLNIPHEPAQGTHICQYCGQSASACEDGDEDHSCDICGIGMNHDTVTAWTHNATHHWHECSCGQQIDSASHVPGAPATATEAQTCTVCGYVITPALGHTTHTPGTDWMHDATHHWNACEGCSQQMNKEAHHYDHACDTTCNDCGATRSITHSYGTTMTHDANKHWYECDICDHKKDEAPHVPGAAATATEAQTCTVCGYVITPALGHTTHTPGTDWMHDATHHWQTCVGCGEQMNKATHGYDSVCDTVCDDCGRQRTATHDYKTEWSKNDTKHWHECDACGDKTDEVEHSFGGWTVVDPPTADGDGSKTRSCICGFSETERIPATGEGTTSGEETTSGEGTTSEEETTGAEESDPTPPDDGEDEGVSAGAVTAIAVGSTVAAGAGGFALWWFVISKKTLVQLGAGCKGAVLKFKGFFGKK